MIHKYLVSLIVAACGGIVLAPDIEIRASSSSPYQIGGTIYKVVADGSRILAAQGGRVVSYDLGDSREGQKTLALVEDGPIRGMFLGESNLFVQTSKSRHVYERQGSGIRHLCMASLERAPSESLFIDGFILDNTVNRGIQVYDHEGACEFTQAGFLDLKTNGLDFDNRANLLAVTGKEDLRFYSTERLPALQEIGRWLGGTRRVVFLEDTKLLVSNETEIMLMDISVIEAPAILATFPYRLAIGDVLAIVGTYIVIYASSGELIVLQYAEQELRVVGRPATPKEEPKSAVEFRDELVVGGEFGLLLLARVGDRWELRVRSTTAADVPSVALASNGAKLIVDRNREILVYRSNSTTDDPPSQVIELDGVYLVAEKDGLMTASYSVDTGAVSSGMWIFRQNEEGVYNNIGHVAFSFPASMLNVGENRVYVCDDNNCPTIYGVGSDNSITRYGTLPISDEHPHKTSLTGDYYIMSAWASGVVIFDVSNPEEPKRIAKVPAASRSNDAIVVGEHLYVADEVEGILVFRQFVTDSPELVVTLPVAQPSDLAYFEKIIVALGSQAGDDVTILRHDNAGPRSDTLVDLPCSARSIALRLEQVLIGANTCGAFVVEMDSRHSTYLPFVTKARR